MPNTDCMGGSTFYILVVLIYWNSTENLMLSTFINCIISVYLVFFPFYWSLCIRDFYFRIEDMIAFSKFYSTGHVLFLVYTFRGL